MGSVGRNPWLWATRVVVVLAVAAGVLIPAWVAPARTLSFPITLTRSASVPSEGRLEFAFVPTHAAFSWTGTEIGGLRYRLISSDGRGRWRGVPEAHDLELGARRYSAVLATLGAVAMEWEPKRRGVVTDVVVDYLNTLDGPRRTVTVPAVARAEASDPEIVTRAEWGADESIKSTSGGCTRRFFNLQQIFVHHTAGSNFDQHPKATMRAIYWYHAVRRGWCDVGYNFVISPDGQIFEGRWARGYAPWEIHSSETRAGRVVAGAHVSGYNSGSLGISLMGNFSEVRPPPEARRSLAELLAWEADRHELDVQATHVYRNPESGLKRTLPVVAGHRDAGSTDCPGDYLYRALGAIRRDAALVMGAGKLSTTVSLAVPAEGVDYAQSVSVGGSLVDQNGAPLGGRTVSLYGRSDGVWSLQATLTTASDGSFTHSVVGDHNVVLRAVYDGDSTTWGADSGNVKLKVHPQVTIEPQGAQFDAGGIAHYPAGTTSIDLAGSVTPAHEGRTVWVHIDRLQSDGMYTPLVKAAATLDDAGTFMYTFAVPGGGTYRTTVHFPSDGDHASTWSDYAYLVVD